MSHVDDGALHAYLDGELAPVERAQIEAHVADCAACRTRLDEERVLIERASQLLGFVQPPPPERAAPPLHQLRHPRPVWRLRVPLTWAASVVLALAVGYYAGGSSFRSAPDEAESDAAAGLAAVPEPLATGLSDRRAAEQGHRQRAARPPAAPAARDTSPSAAFPQAIYAERGRTDAAGIGRIEARAIDLDSARALLGGEIHAIDAVAIDAVRRLGGNAVVLEQRVAPGVVVQLREEAEPAGRATVTMRTGPGQLVGRVTDAANAAPLVGARVVLRGTTREARTNERGAFAMDSVPPGAHGLQAGMIGYEPYLVLAPVDSGRTTVVEVSLSQAAVTLSEVVVTGAARAAPGAHAAPAPDLVRRIGRVRISISGPLPPDSLSKLLAKLAPIR